MKKYFILAIAAVAALAACSKVETVDNAPDSPIRFSVVNHMQRTKATQGLTYPTSVPFGANAWWTQETWDNTAASSKQTYVFMVNQEVAYDATNAEWAPTVPFYWTKTGYITFASYSPYVDDSTKASKGFSAIPEYNVNNGYIFTDYTIVDNTDVDLMYSDLAADCTKNTNKNGADVTDDQKTGTTDSGFVGVPTIFNHALCQIGFAFRAIGRMNPNVDRIVVELEDVDIVNIDKKGTFTQIPTTGTVKWASDHTVAANLANYDYQPASTITLNLIENTAANVAATTNYTALDITRILLPQELEEDDDPTDLTVDPIETTTDQKLVVTYTIKIHYTSAPTDESDPAYWATEQVTSEVRLNNGTIAAWRDNQNITYRISINPYSTVPVTFDPAVIDWTDIYSTDINLNEFDD